MSDELRGQGVRTQGDTGAWLKWHQLRRHQTEAPFLRDNLTRGLQLGASMEVDLRLLECGNFVCLHDGHLDEETTGSGPVSALAAAAVGALRIRATDGTPTQSSPLLLSELVDLIKATPRRPGSARVQLDLKAAGAALTDPVCAQFAATVAPVADDLLLSAHDWSAIKRLSQGVSGLALGYDPSDIAPDWDFSEPGKAQEFCRYIADHAPDAAMIYLYYQIVGQLIDDGFDIIATLHDLGFSVDCWTIDDGQPDTLSALQKCLAAGADQITTNGPLVLEKLAGDLATNT